MLAMTRIRVLFLSLILSGVAGCSQSSPLCSGDPPPPPYAASRAKTYDYTHKVTTCGAADTAAPVASCKPTLRWSVAILRFGDTKDVEGQPFGDERESASASGGQINVSVRAGDEINFGPNETPPLFGKRSRDLLKNELIESKAFVVVERERILEILREINFGKTTFVDPVTAPKQGEVMGVRYIIEGSLGLDEEELSDDTDNDRARLDFTADTSRNLFDCSKSKRQKEALALNRLKERRLKDRTRGEYEIACYLSVYDVHSGEVVTMVKGSASDRLEAIRDAVGGLVSELAKQDTGVRVACVSGEKVYLDVGSFGGMQGGERFRVTHPGTEIRDRQGQIIGREETEVGEIEVVEVQKYLSIARFVRKAGTIERGDIAKVVVR